ncbi:MAG: sulfatase-like hydrolase/transferase [Thermoanaerobaculia bacterium]|nr:sulfatase-like hydrolase/transferase [Thermoanaerobaculia bacterium]
MPSTEDSQPASNGREFRVPHNIPRWWLVPAVGSAAGSTALVLDTALEITTGGTPIGSLDLARNVVVIYLAFGVVTAMLAWTSTRVLRREIALTSTFAWAMLLPYLIPVWERLESILAGLLAAIVAPAGTILWAGVLHRVMGKTVGRDKATLLATFSIALLLAVHRNLLPGPLEPQAIAVSAACLVAILGLAFTARARARAVVAVAWVVLLTVAMFLAQGGRIANPGERTTTGFDESTRPPHVILLTVDTLRLDIFERVVASTPEGLAFARALSGATFFDRARAPSPWTAPSLATVMTGLLPDEHGYGVRTGSEDRPLAGLSAELPTLAEGMQAAGYRTEAFVANPILFPGSGIDRGFDVYRALEDAGRKLPWMRWSAIRPIRRATRRWIRRLPYLPAQRVADLVERRIAAIDDADVQPYFVWIHLMDPHAPFIHHSGLTEDPTSKHGRYRGEVRFTLRHVTRIVEALDAAGLWDESVAVFTSDHGEMFPHDRHEEPAPSDGGAPRRAGHGHSLHTEVVRIPLAIRTPEASQRAKNSRQLVSLVDLLPTLEDLLGLPLGLELTPSARSLVNQLEGEQSGVADRTVTLAGNEWGPRQRGLVQGRWKLIHLPDRESGDRLYDLASDPQEQRNLSKDRPEITDELRRRLEAAWTEMRLPPSSEGSQIDEETRSRLKALGYLD